jgi:hypothetical protein
MFRLIEPSSSKIQNIVLVHSVSAHYGIPYCLQAYIDVKDNLLADVYRLIDYLFGIPYCLQNNTDVKDNLLADIHRLIDYL